MSLSFEAEHELFVHAENGFIVFSQLDGGLTEIRMSVLRFQQIIDQHKVLIQEAFECQAD